MKKEMNVDDKQESKPEQLKRSAAGLQVRDKSIQGHVVSLSPLRDLAVMGPIYLAYSFVGAAQELELRILRGDPEAGALADQAVRLAEKISAFVEKCTGYESVSNVAELSEQAGLPDPELADAERLLGQHLLRALLGAYHRGVRDSLRQGEEPLNKEMLWAYVQKYGHLRKEADDGG